MYAYLIILKENGFCSQVNRNNKPSWILDNEYCFNIPMNPDTASQYLGKYYYNNTWWSRVFNMVELVNENGETVLDNEGNPVMVPGETYTDYPFEAVFE